LAFFPQPVNWCRGRRPEPRAVCDAKPRNAFAFLNRAEVRAVSRDHPKTQKARCALVLSPKIIIPHLPLSARVNWIVSQFPITRQTRSWARL